MKCNNNLCIHNFGKECELEEITVDWRGNCENMQHICFSDSNIQLNKLYTQAFLDNKLEFDDNTGEYHYLKSNNEE